MTTVKRLVNYTKEFYLLLFASSNPHLIILKEQRHKWLMRIVDSLGEMEKKKKMKKLVMLTAGLALLRVRGKSLVPAPPPSIMEATVFGSAGVIPRLCSCNACPLRSISH